MSFYLSEKTTERIHTVWIHEAAKYAKAILSQKRKWTKNATARDMHDHVVTTVSPSAVCFCATGAMTHALYKLDGPYPVRLSFVMDISTPMIIFNDAKDTTHEQIMWMFDELIKVTKPQFKHAWLYYALGRWLPWTMLNDVGPIRANDGSPLRSRMQTLTETTKWIDGQDTTTVQSSLM